MSSDGPLVSVIMPCYRMDKFIPESLESIGSQTYHQWEVIAVDDCCPNNRTEDLVRSFAERFKDHRVVSIRHQENRGVSAARNTAISSANGQLYAFLDPDDYWRPEYLATGVQFLSDHTRYAAVSSPVVIRDEQAENDQQIVYGPNQYERNWFPYSLSGRNFLQPSSTIVRADMVDLVKGFDEDPALQHVEDWDLWIRLVIAGAEFGILDEPHCVYRKHPGAATSDMQKLHRLIETLMGKHQGWFLRMQGGLLYRATHELMTRSATPETPRLGPVMRVANKLDRVLLRVYDRLFKRP